MPSKQKWRFCFCSRFLVPIGKPKTRKKMATSKTQKWRVHFWKTKTTPKVPFLFCFWSARAKRQIKIELLSMKFNNILKLMNAMMCVIKAVRSYYKQVPAVINSWKQHRRWLGFAFDPRTNLLWGPRKKRPSCKEEGVLARH